jgi:hypothetical protein
MLILREEKEINEAKDLIAFIMSWLSQASSAQHLEAAYVGCRRHVKTTGIKVGLRRCLTPTISTLILP